MKGMFNKRYLKAGGAPGIRNKSRQEKGEVALRQRRYREHPIKDGKDFVQHVDDIHVNPVKHGYARMLGSKDEPKLHAVHLKSLILIPKSAIRNLKLKVNVGFKRRTQPTCWRNGLYARNRGSNSGKFPLKNITKIIGISIMKIFILA